MRRWWGSAAAIIIGLVALLWLWLVPSQVAYPRTGLEDGGVVHSRSCGVPVVHAWSGYSSPQGHIGWLYDGPHEDYQECIEQSIGHTLLGVGSLGVGVVAGVLLRPRRRRTTRESSLDWRAMEAGSSSAAAADLTPG